MVVSGLRKLKALLSAAILVGVVAAPCAVAAQQPAANNKPQATWRVRVKQNGTYFLTVRAREAPLSEIAADLSRRLKAPVILSRVMNKQRVTLDFQDLPLETALQMMAPLTYIHYELRGGSAPICREVFLNAYNEPVPAPKLDNKNVSFVMEGDTEAAVQEDPLHVTYKNGLLSVNVKKQSLSAVLDRIAMLLGVNFVMKQDTDATIDLDFKEMSLEEAISYFPPSVHLHVRKDIQRTTSVPLMLELAN
jgi:type II secretory pathway component GspD/PulD (secretin)